MQKTNIKFIAGWKGYIKGDVASFPTAQAEALIKSGYAEILGAEKDPEAAALKRIAQAPQTKHIPGPKATKSSPKPKGPSKPRGAKK